MGSSYRSSSEIFCIKTCDLSDPCLETSSSNSSAYLKAWIQFTLWLYVPLCNFQKYLTRERITSLYYFTQSHNLQVANESPDTTSVVFGGFRLYVMNQFMSFLPPSRWLPLFLFLIQWGFSYCLSLRAYYVSDIVLNTSYMSSNLIPGTILETSKIMPILQIKIQNSETQNKLHKLRRIFQNRRWQRYNLKVGRSDSKGNTFCQ